MDTGNIHGSEQCTQVTMTKSFFHSIKVNTDISQGSLVLLVSSKMIRRYYSY